MEKCIGTSLNQSYTLHLGFLCIKKDYEKKGEMMGTKLFSHFYKTSLCDKYQVRELTTNKIATSRRKIRRIHVKLLYIPHEIFLSISRKQKKEVTFLPICRTTTYMLHTFNLNKTQQNRRSISKNINYPSLTRVGMYADE